MSATMEQVLRLRKRVAEHGVQLGSRTGGRLQRVVGLTLEAVGCPAGIGQRCLVVGRTVTVEAEVVGFGDRRTFLMPLGDPAGLAPGDPVLPQRHGRRALAGPALLGRIVDAFGRPLDGKGPVGGDERLDETPRRLNPLDRRPIHAALDVGVRAINSMLTVGRGQRVGLFAGSGVGKSTLLGMMARYTAADVNVVGLVGERGREVQDFVIESLGEEGLARSVVVAAPADDPPLMRLRAADLAARLAEDFRDRGRDVLLLMDSLTRYAQAQREIALAVGEPPATKGYPPSVFALLPKLVERAGTGPVGSVTAFYTVLAEGDDTNDPVADAARAILDGHIVLSRSLAEAGHFPAIDVEASVSRLYSRLATPEQQCAAQDVRRLLATHSRQRDLISVGAYTRGSDPETDLAIDMMPDIRAVLTQDTAERASLEDSIDALTTLMDGAG